MPYNTLLHKSTREASGIRLEGNIFIIDEAHNLLDTIGHIHSSQINGQQVFKKIKLKIFEHIFIIFYNQGNNNFMIFKS